MTNPSDPSFARRLKDFFDPPYTPPTLDTEISPQSLSAADFMLLTGVKTKDHALIAEALRQNADPNVKDGEALIRAAHAWDLPTAKRLVAGGANVTLAMETAKRRELRPNHRGDLETYSLTSLYSTVEYWLKKNHAELLQHYIEATVPALQAERARLREEVAGLRAIMEEEGLPRLVDKKIILRPK